MDDKKSPISVFIIGPIGDNGSPERKRIDGLISLIKENKKELNIATVSASHTIDISGKITHQILKSLITVDLVISDISNHNPNVMYELAVRHAQRRPCILIATNNTIIPFDIHDNRVLYYEDSIAGYPDFFVRLKTFVGMTTKKTR
ncbi:hypothetical protein [Phaeocystidibacter marisrubri]|uniref:Uncharacterized protein n=1 Tax=Phaeocystidibacter marisrubri TaxID=1577780 RepID=A0A6L3ZCE7_9FLAO|nr:hypothetical protein [Phaeocystidibacter marisrubri]KAB2815515.1 hypothetical protein F8C82_07355 [Phaeocystidibacter marisrubri]GGH64287.1 hypothetical protein GCM10011318_00160 [Phaeocystidibacter marisrubri]